MDTHTHKHTDRQTDGPTNNTSTKTLFCGGGKYTNKYCKTLEVNEKQLFYGF